MYEILMMALGIMVIGSLVSLFCITFALVGVHFWIAHAVKKKDYDAAETGAHTFLYAIIAYAVDLVFLIGAIVSIAILHFG